MGKVAVFLLFLAGIAIGAGGKQMWEWKSYVDAIAAKDALQGERDELVKQLERARIELGQAQAAARNQRKSLYETDKSAADWARAPVPDALRDRMRDAAIAAEKASRRPER